MADAFQDRLDGSLQRTVEAGERSQTASTCPKIASSSASTPTKSARRGRRPGDSGHSARLPPDPFRGRGEGRQARLHGKAGGHRRARACAACWPPPKRRRRRAWAWAWACSAVTRPATSKRSSGLQDGAIGDIVAARVYWNGRTSGSSRAQAEPDRNGIPDAQLVLLHLAVRRSHRRTAHPQHGRHQLAEERLTRSRPTAWAAAQVRKGKEYGEIFDHHAVEFEYADGSRMFSQCRHIPNCWNSV